MSDSSILKAERGADSNANPHALSHGIQVINWLRFLYARMETENLKGLRKKSAGALNGGPAERDNRLDACCVVTYQRMRVADDSPFVGWDWRASLSGKFPGQVC